MKPKTEDFTITLDVSAFRKPFSEQFRNMDLKVNADRYEEAADAIFYLQVNGYINPAAGERARLKLVKNLCQEAKRQCPEKLTSVGRPRRGAPVKKGGAK